MAFFQSAVGVLQTLVVALGAGLAVWGGCFGRLALIFLENAGKPGYTPFKNKRSLISKGDEEHDSIANHKAIRL